MNCVQCGKPLDDGTKFCIFCGARQPGAPGPVMFPETSAEPAAMPDEPAPYADTPALPNESAPYAETPALPNGPAPYAETPALPNGPAPYAETPAAPQSMPGGFVPAPPAAAPKKNGAALPWILTGILAFLLIAGAVAALLFWNSTRSAFGNSIAMAESDYAGLEDRYAARGSEIAELNDTVKQKDEELESLNGSVAQKDEEIALLNSAIAEKDAEIGELTGAAEAKDEEIASLNDTLSARETELDSLRDAAASLEEMDAVLAERENEISSLNADNEELQSFRDSIIWNSKHYSLGGTPSFGAYPAVLIAKVGEATPLTLYENFNGNFSISVVHTGRELTWSSRTERFDGSAILDVTILEPGITRMDFTNDVDNSTFSILVIGVE